MIFAIVDIGSHTLRLAVYERKNGVDFLLTKTKYALGLAGYLKSGMMTDEGITALVGFLKVFRKFLNAFEINEVYTFATAAIRMSKNQMEILTRIKQETGFEVRVLNGQEEAEFAFMGATRDCPINRGVLLDIGGGSTEMVKFDEGKILKKYSLPIGAVSLSKKYGGEFFPETAVREQIRQATIDELKKANVAIKAEDALALGGAAKGAKILLDRSANDPIELAELMSLEKRFGTKLTENDKSLLLREVPDRAQILIAGFCVLSTLMEEFGIKRFYFSKGGVREGFIDRYVK